MDKLPDKLGSKRNDKISLSDEDTIRLTFNAVNDLINPSMEPTKVNSVINKTLNISNEHTPESIVLNPENDDVSVRTTEVHIETGSDQTNKKDKDTKKDKDIKKIKILKKDKDNK